MDHDVRLYRIGCGAALVAGPALFFVDNLIHPEELGRGNETAQLAFAGSARGSGSSPALPAWRD